MSVHLFTVHSHISKTTHPDFTKYSVCITCEHGSVLWQKCSICYLASCQLCPHTCTPIYYSNYTGHLVLASTPPRQLRTWGFIKAELKFALFAPFVYSKQCCKLHVVVITAATDKKSNTSAAHGRWLQSKQSLLCVSPSYCRRPILQIVPLFLSVCHTYLSILMIHGHL